ncbi:UNVERIFIED_CONTAM: hypothetical protein FKN15_024217, partial [Acipenser sinensis]
FFFHSSKPSWADQVEEEGDEGTLPPPKEILKGNTKTIIEYKVDEDGKRFKIIRTFKIETRKASKAVARRKNWKKFGQSEFDAPGPNVATTTVSDDVYMTFISSKEGFAFISFHRREDAARAIAGVSGFGYDHLILNVEWAK